MLKSAFLHYRNGCTKRYITSLYLFDFTDTQSQSQERAAMATSRTNLALGHMGKGNSQTPMMFIATLTNLMVRQPQNEAFLILRVN